MDPEWLRPSKETSELFQTLLPKINESIKFYDVEYTVGTLRPIVRNRPSYWEEVIRFDSDGLIMVADATAEPLGSVILEFQNPEVSQQVTNTIFTRLVRHLAFWNHRRDFDILKRKFPSGFLHRKSEIDISRIFVEFRSDRHLSWSLGPLAGTIPLWIKDRFCSSGKWNGGEKSFKSRIRFFRAKFQDRQTLLNFYVHLENISRNEFTQSMLEDERHYLWAVRSLTLAANFTYELLDEGLHPNSKSFKDLQTMLWDGLGRSCPSSALAAIWPVLSKLPDDLLQEGNLIRRLVTPPRNSSPEALSDSQHGTSSESASLQNSIPELPQTPVKNAETDKDTN
ncbi:hypothetical protein SBOR_3970 [Sclerotinia borealis F-4128]|uniref:Uncharacterized protein n=1 Tax=Sclerotinia borealis (strain F-4128) TaxID=1432307 RepID=W9CLX3_SCLBF|nr:hypothetical protein SBOR_3970 [Sclerotinia borealis F-4128]